MMVLICSREVVRGIYSRPLLISTLSKEITADTRHGIGREMAWGVLRFMKRSALSMVVSKRELT